MGRINMEKEGTRSCTDPEGECRNSPILDKSGTCAHPPAARDHLGTRTDQQPRRACSHLRHVPALIHISEPTTLLSITYAVFCLKNKTSDC
mgnify:CR=1 FL=1